MKLIKKMLTETKNVERSGAIWNMIAVILFSFQQVIFSMFVTHLISGKQGQDLAGLFGFGYAQANLFLCLGKYGIKYFQISDVEREYNFREYRMSRIITSIAMLVISIGFVPFAIYNYKYSLHNALVIFMVCLLKLPDALEDVYIGEYQKNERLDVASKIWAIRYLITIIVMIILFLITRDLLITLIVSTIVTTVILGVFIIATKEFVSERNPYDMKKVWKQILVAFPLALGAYLTLYIGVAPRNAIAQYIADLDIQGIYNYLAMPGFVVSMMVTFVLNPKIYHISCLWDEKKMPEYLKEVMKQVAFAIAVTIVCFGCAALLGVPVLSLIFNVDLVPYKIDLLMMMIGSGFYGLATLLGYLLTVMRYQNAVLVGYIISSISVFFVADYAVKNYGVRGAVFSYVAAVAILCLVFTVEMVYGVIKHKNSPKTSEQVSNS